MEGERESFSNRRAIRKILPEIRTCASALRWTLFYLAPEPSLAAMEISTGMVADCRKRLSDKAFRRILPV
jgi:hypothetical protein